MGEGIGFIGAGNMGGALFRGIAKAFPALRMAVYDVDLPKARALVASAAGKKRRSAERFAVAATPEAALAGAGIVFVAVKPQIYEEALKRAAPALERGSAVICMAPGWPIARVSALLPSGVSVIRIMPNIQAEVGEAMTAVCPGPGLPAELLDTTLALLRAVGRTEIIEEKLFNAVTGLSGSGGAYAFMFIEAMADGAVLNGIPRDKAYAFAAQTVLGAAKMVLESGAHPGSLKDRVCSPGGTTIEAVRTLERLGFRSAVIEAVAASTAKAAALESASGALGTVKP